MTTPDDVRAEEARKLGRPVYVLGFTSQHVRFRAIEHEVVTAVYDAGTPDYDQLRWCVYIDGKCDSGGIVDTRGGVA